MKVSSAKLALAATLLIAASSVVLDVAPSFAQYPEFLNNIRPTLRGGAGNTTLQGGAGNTLLQGGAGNTMLQGGTGSTTIQAGTGASLLQTGVERQAQPTNILFIVDGSRSMLEGLGRDTQKIDAAKQVLQNAITHIPGDVNVGLRVFGQGYQGPAPSMFGGGIGTMDNECRNSALWVPLGRGNRRTIMDKVRQIKPYGMTPLAFAIEQAATSDFRGVSGSKVIILITDGADTCGGNPCKVIEQLPVFGINIKVDVVGLNLRREPGARNQLNCIAEKSGGKYYDANTAADLIESVSQSVSKAIEGRIIVKPQSGGQQNLNTQTPPQLIPIEPIDVPVPGQ